jgi:hypothetical protein
MWPFPSPRLDWEKINRTINAVDAVRGPGERGPEGVAAAVALPADYPQKVKQAFDETAVAFNDALDSLRNQIKVIHWIIFPALGVAVASGVIAIVFFKPLVGSLLSGGGLTCLYACIAQSWELGRRQALLELVPRLYGTMFQVARTPDQYDQAFEAYKEELIQIRRIQWGATKPVG